MPDSATDGAAKAPAWAQQRHHEAAIDAKMPNLPRRLAASEADAALRRLLSISAGPAAPLKAWSAQERRATAAAEVSPATTLAAAGLLALPSRRSC